MNIINVTKENVRDTGFFCKMSNKKGEGYQRKLRWLEKRFDEGLKIKLLDLSEGGRGFIEYIPGEYAWRAVDVPNYMVVHCLWVVGKSKGKGLSGKLLNMCVADAKKLKLSGVAMMSSEVSGAVSKKYLLHQEFEVLNEYGPKNAVMVKRFGNAPLPRASYDLKKRCQKHKKGITVLSSDQCPYNADAEKIIKEIADDRKIDFKIKHLNTAEDVRKLSPSVYGVYGIVKDGKYVSNPHVTRKRLEKMIDEQYKT